MNSLITSYEVVKYGPVAKTYSPADVCDHINRVEFAAFTKCYLGLDFYKALQADLIDLSTVPKYLAISTYALGDMVNHGGTIYKSTVDGNDVSPEDDKTKWGKPDKFNTECYEELWVSILRYWIAMEVIYASIRYTTFKAGAHGITKFYDEDTKSLSVGNAIISEYKKDLRYDIDTYLDLIMNWISEYNGTGEGQCDFSMVGVAKEGCGDDVSCRKPARRRRMHFKN